MNIQKHKDTIYRNLGKDLINLLKTTNAILAGGAITSLFSSKEINDYDIYFRNKEDLIVFVRNAFVDEENLEEDQFVDVGAYTLICTSYTNKSITFSMNNDLKIQLIHFDYFESINDIFNSYDFKINMGAFDFKTEEFVLHDDFLIDIASRRLCFNEKTAYPIMSSLRVQKYIERGYVISKKEMFKIGLAIADLNISSWQELEDQLSGFYGIDISLIFDKTKEFSLLEAIDALDKVEELPDFERNSNPSLKQILFSVQDNPFKDQQIFFHYVSVQDDKIKSYDTYYYEDDDTTILWKYDNIYNVKNLQVLTNKVDVSNRWFPGNVKLLVLESVDTVMTMGVSELELTGNVKVIGLLDKK